MSGENEQGVQSDQAAQRVEPVGVVGGLGPAATVYFMRRMVELTDAATDQEHVDLLVWQHGSTPDRTAFLRGEGESPVPALVGNARALEAAGARFIAMPCNTGVAWVEAMRAAVSVEVVSIVDETVAAAVAARPGLRRLGLLATDGTHLARTYAVVCEAAGIELVVPDDDVQREVMSVIYDGVKAGRPVSRERFDTVVGHLRAKGAEVVALGCTELSVLYGDLGIDDPTVVDSVDALARVVIRRAGAPLRD